MDTEVAAVRAGLVACVLVLTVLAAPYVLLTDPSGLGAYYAAGPIGAGALVLLAPIEVVALLSGTRGQADPSTAAGVASVVGLAIALVALLWATGVDSNLVFSFPAADSWIENHRWVVVAASVLVPGSALAWARTVV